MIHKLYFSPTGGTKKVVTLVADVWKESQCEIDLSISHCDCRTDSFTKADICIVGVPSFGGRVPTVALEHLKQMRAENTKTILIVAYGNRDYDDTLLELQATLVQNGFQVIAAIAAVTEHSIMHQFGTGRPNEEDKKILQDYGQRIQQKLESGVEVADITVKGNMPYREYNGLPLKPKADKSCNNCGICAKACPVQAIPMDQPSKTQKDICITCMRCVTICPKHARGLNHAMLFAAGKKMEKSCSLPKENILFV